jgi:hypothetical protein
MSDASATERAQMEKVINTYKAMQKELQQIGQKVGELQAEGHEHE